MENQRNKGIIKAVLIATTLCLLITLGIYAYAGLFMRYSGDDYNYGAYLTQNGVIGGVAYAYTHIEGIQGDRFSTTIFALLASLLPPRGNGLLPLLALILWVCCLYLIFKELMRDFTGKIFGILAIMSSSFLVLITLYTTPDHVESLFWRSGLLPYLAPIIFILILAIMITRAFKESQPITKRLLLLFLVSLMTGGFSETGIAVQMSLLFFWFIFNLISNTPNKKWRLQVIFTAIVGGVSALVVMFLSPAIHWEISDSNFIQNFWKALSLSIYHANDFIQCSIQCLPLPNIVIALFALISAIFTYDELEARGVINFHNVGFVLMGTIIVAYVSIVSSMVPSAFIRNVYPNPRCIILPKAVLNFSLFVLAYVAFVGMIHILGGKKMSGTVPVCFALILCMGIGIYSLRAGTKIFPDILRYKTWAHQWDIRDAYIREMAAQGEDEIHVPQIEKIIQWVGELGESGRGVNAAAARFYDVEFIYADIPNDAWDWNDE